ncbi:ArsR family transcriptional regulator [Streptomyces sp. x-80]|uniref:ArsR family transcriptional regulator n=1 Tax=Streptomyces sp. x-80 TaxID=2789282 RepID=UPI00397F9996
MVGTDRRSRTSKRRQDLDARGLRPLAHSVRVQLVGPLRTYGPSTATRLAAHLGITSGTASHRLRRLGAAGGVKEDTERGNAGGVRHTS